jgi:hypothetical protein
VDRTTARKGRTCESVGGQHVTHVTEQVAEVFAGRTCEPDNPHVRICRTGCTKQAIVLLGHTTSLSSGFEVILVFIFLLFAVNFVKPFS